MNSHPPPSTITHDKPSALILAALLLDAQLFPMVHRLMLLLQEKEEEECRPSSSSDPQSHDNASLIHIDKNVRGKNTATIINIDTERTLKRLVQIKEAIVSLRDRLKHIHEAVEAATVTAATTTTTTTTITTPNDATFSNHETYTTIHDRQRVHFVRRVHGIIVPLLKILQYTKEWTFRTTDAMHLPPPPPGVVRSAMYAIVQEAALALMDVCRFLWRIHSSFGFGKDTAATEEEEEDDDEGWYVRTLVIPILVSCVMALSCLDVSHNDNDEEVKEDEEANVGDKEETTTTGSKYGAMDVMDRGEDCAMTLLLLIQTVVSMDKLGEVEERTTTTTSHGESEPVQYDEVSSVSSLSSLAKQVGNAMGGSLMARLVVGCLSLLTTRGGEILNRNEASCGLYVRHEGNSVMLQLESLKTLRVLLRSIPVPELWKSILPGSFAGLYRSALANLRYTSVASAHKVASESVLVLALLLKQSLSTSPTTNDPKDRHDNTTTQTILSSLLQVVDRAKHASDAKDCNTSLPQSKERIDSFGKEVNTRLPGPLSVLLGILPNNRSRLVRKSGIYLSGVLLTDAWHVWSEDTAEGLGRKAFEYCLMMLSDDDVELQKSSQVLCSHINLIGIQAWRLRLSKSIVPAILELIEALPIFAKSGRDIQVCNHLRLINGYLLISFRDNMDCQFDIQECMAKKRKSDIGSALSCPDALNTIQKSFSVLFTPDISTIVLRPVIENGVGTDPNLIIPRRENRSFRFLHLLDDTIVMTRHTVQLLACALGAKRSAYLVDACFADVFQSCIRSFGGDLDNAFPAEGQNRRLDWCGSCIFATEILAGMCCRDNENERSKRSRSEQRILTSLISSVLPVVVSHPLWTLPTSLQDDTRFMMSKPSYSDVAMYSTDIMRCNAVLVCSLMGFISQAAQSLGEDMRLHLSILLLPLLERASAIGNHPSVQTCAFETLSDVALWAGYSDIFSLLTANFDYIMDHISLRLRKHSKERTAVSRSLLGVVDVVLRYVVRDQDANSSNVPIVGHMLQCLLSYSDRMNDLTISRIQSFDTICVLRSINDFMDSSIDAQIKCGGDIVPSLKSEDDGYDWLKKLDFELERDTEGCYDGDFYENAFDEVDTTDVGDEPPPFPNGEGVNRSDSSDTSFGKEISSINEVLKRCAYLLCDPNLHMQVLCSVTLLSGFKSLGKIGAYRKSLRGESASNPLLPAIAEYWPSIVARLRSTSSELHSKRMMSRSELSVRRIMATDQDESRSEASLIVLLSKLLEIVSELCSISDGFFAGRFESDVYPILATLLGDCIPDEMDRVARNRSQTFSLGENRHSALSPILLCLKCAFETSCKSGLAGLISSCGTILFPLLSCQGQVGDHAVDVLKTMLQVDCDILWRPIHRLSGESFPCNPMRHFDKSMDQPNDDGDVVCRKSALQFKTESCNIMAKRAKDLLLFIDELPEQNIY